jgi:glycosyltransferase involved in cell wall biosynthesis
MHVALNAYFWNQPFVGSGQYLRQLVYHLNRLVADVALTLVYPSTAVDDIPTAVPPSVNVHLVPTRPGHLGKILFEQRGFPQACAHLGVDLAHVPYWAAPLSSPVPVILTIHDLIPLIIPEYQHSLGSRLYNGLVSASARGASHIITDSITSQEDVTRYLGIPPERISPIYLGVGREYSPDDNFLLDMAIRQKYGLPDDYILYLGGFTTHKNVTTLLRAYPYIQKGLGTAYPLLLAGKKPEKVSPQFPDYSAFIRELGLEEQVRWLGFVDEADKPVLYRSASCFVFPSRYEGFGLPPLEAMACHTPVIATTAPGVAEIVGEAAMAVPPEDERALAGAIIATLIQENLAAELRAKGAVRAQESLNVIVKAWYGSNHE